MGQKEKRIDRLKQTPTDYTYEEGKGLLGLLGFIEKNKGSTSGSRVLFFREKDRAKILLHKPHPSSVMKVVAVKQLLQELKDLGDIQ